MVNRLILTQCFSTFPEHSKCLIQHATFTQPLSCIKCLLTNIHTHSNSGCIVNILPKISGMQTGGRQGSNHQPSALSPELHPTDSEFSVFDRNIIPNKCVRKHCKQTRSDTRKNFLLPSNGLSRVTFIDFIGSYYIQE